MNKQKVVEQLKEEKMKLTKIFSDAEKRLRKAPNGTIRISKHKNKYQFYLREKTTDKIGVYIPVSKHSLATALIQKKYDQQIRKISQKQINAITDFLKKYKPDILKDFYSSLPEIRKQYIVPVELSDAEYEMEWLSAEYVHKDFKQDTPEHFTSKGERVRSKSEVMIADTLYRMDIAYKYEYPLNLQETVIHPDFTILRRSDREIIYWEHLGMMDEPEYCNNALKRIRNYESNGIFPGINLILTMETHSLPTTITEIEKMIQTYCK